MTKTVWSIAFASALAGALVLASAATSNRGALAHSDGYAAGEPGDPSKAARVVEIVMEDGPGTMTYRPDRIEVSKGEQIKFVLKNLGVLRHEFVINSFENNAKHKAEMAKSPNMHHDERNEKDVDPKQTAELLWRFTKAGTFEFACLIPGHYETGMKGVVVAK